MTVLNVSSDLQFKLYHSTPAKTSVQHSRKKSEEIIRICCFDKNHSKRNSLERRKKNPIFCSLYLMLQKNKKFNFCIGFEFSSELD